MRCSSRHTFSIAAAIAGLLASSTTAQTQSKCNPLVTTCPPDTALGMTVNVDFRKGEVNSFLAQGNPTYGDDGVSLAVAQAGNAPQLTSVFYIMFGHVEITLKTAPGTGMVSSCILISDDLDEIDMEWLGADATQMQSNYFPKGQPVNPNPGQTHDVPNTQSDFVTYSLDWTPQRIVWMVGGTELRTLTYDDAGGDNYPQTPMQIRMGSWAGGDSSNAPGTIAWAGGPIDYSAGPYTMTVQKLTVTDYSTGKEYTYSNTNGTWQSIEAKDGDVYGNADGSKGQVTATASAAGAAVTTGLTVPAGHIATDDSAATSTQTGWPYEGGANPTAGAGAIPSGWYLTPDGKVKPEQDGKASSLAAPQLAFVYAVVLLGSATFFTRLW